MIDVAVAGGDTGGIEAVHGRKRDAAVHRAGVRRGDISVGGSRPSEIAALRVFCAKSRDIPVFLSIL